METGRGFWFKMWIEHSANLLSSNSLIDYLVALLISGMCEMVIVNDESDIIQMKQRKKLGMLHPDESYVLH